MKKIRFIGLLATVLLLAFGLTLSCDNGTTTTDDTDPVTTTYYDTANNITITFSNKAIEARARAAGPNDGDYYQIKRGSALLSSGTIQLQGNGTTIKFIEDSGATFTGQFLNNLLTINDTVGGQALTVSASTPGTSGGGSPSTGPSGGGTSPSGGGGGVTNEGKAIGSWTLYFDPTKVTDQGFTITEAYPVSSVSLQDVEYAAGLSSGSSPTTAWQKALDFNGLQPEKEYAVWARTAAITAAESAARGGNGSAYTTGPVKKGPALVTTLAKGETGAAISSFVVVGTSTHEKIFLTNPAVVTNNPGGQAVEYAVSKTTTAPTSGWLSFADASNPSVGFTGLDPVTPYNVFARTKYTPASGGNPAYSAGTAFKGDQPIPTKKAPGLDITDASKNQTLVTIAPGSPTGTEEVGGELFAPKPATVAGNAQPVEYTFSKTGTGDPSTGLAAADTFKWWTPSPATEQEPTSGTAGLVGISKAVTVSALSSGAIKFAGILGSSTTAAETYGIYARSKEDDTHLRGDAVLLGTAVKVLIKPPALLDIEAEVDTGSATTAGFDVVISPTHESTDPLTDPYLAVALEFNLATGTNSTTPVKPTWAAYTPPTEVTFTGLESGTTYALLVRVKKDTNFAQGQIYVADGDLETDDGTDIDTDDNILSWAPTLAATGKWGLKLTVTGVAAIVDDQGDPVPSPPPVEYGITLATTQTTTTSVLKLGTIGTGDVTFEGLAQKTDYSLWARFAADGTGGTNTGDWVKAPGTFTTGESAVYTSTNLNALTIPTRTATGFTVSGIVVKPAAPHDNQDWELTVGPAPTGAIPTNATPPTGATWVTANSSNPRTASFADLEAGKPYLVFIRSKAADGEFDAGTPQVLPIKGVTLMAGADMFVVWEWLETNFTDIDISGGAASTACTITFTFAPGVTTLPNLPNGQTVSFGIGKGDAAPATTWVLASTITQTPITGTGGLKTDIVTGQAGSYRVWARANANDDYGAGASVATGLYDGILGD